MLQRETFPTKFDAYNRYNTREASMDRPVRGVVSQTEESSSNKSCSCGCQVSQNVSASDVYTNTQHALYMKYSNVRIKYVGFIYNNVNYIVDLDNRKVLCKPLYESTYQQLRKRVNVTSDTLTKSYKLSFNAYKERVAISVEVYPNDIENCNVNFTNIDTHEHECLAKDYIAFEYFDWKNMLDEKGNVITFMSYNDIFNLTTDNLMTLFTYTEAIEYIKSILDNVKYNRDLVEVVTKLLLDVRTKYAEYVENQFNPDVPDCPCPHPHHPPHPPQPKPPVPPCPPQPKPPLPPHPPVKPTDFDKESLIGVYYSENGSTINLMEEFFAECSFCKKDDRLIWDVYFVGNLDQDRIEDIIVKITNLDDNDKEFKFSYKPEIKKLVNLADNKDTYEKDIIAIPSILFACVGSDYVNPVPIFEDGAINENNTDLNVIENYDNFKSVSINLEREYILHKKHLDFVFQRNNTYVTGNNVYLTELGDFNDLEPEYKFLFKTPFGTSTENTCNCNGQTRYHLPLKTNEINSIDAGIINYVYVTINCKYKEYLTDTDYKDRTYLVEIKLV